MSVDNSITFWKKGSNNIPKDLPSCHVAETSHSGLIKAMQDLNEYGYEIVGIEIDPNHLETIILKVIPIRNWRGKTIRNLVGVGKE